MRTNAGQFGIGFRLGGTVWKAATADLCDWAKRSGFASLDLGKLDAAQAAVLKEAGLAVGSVDLLQFGEITDPDPGKRRDLLAQNLAYIRKASQLGAKIFFTIIGGDPTKTRLENYRAAVECFSPLAEAADAVGGTLAIEGYPGHGPHYALLCTTPETCRAFLKDLPRGVGLNYDPSHLIRLGVDHLRFLNEFSPRVVHVHAKDTLLLSEGVYEYGLFQPAAFAPPHRYGQHAWRYTLPGRGMANWQDIFSQLKKTCYGGFISVELEDEDFNGDEEREKAGLLQSLKFLSEV